MKSHKLTLTDALDVAQNRQLWKLLARQRLALHTLVVQDNNDDDDDDDDDESHGVRVHVKFCVVVELCESLCFFGIWLPAAVQVIDYTSFTVATFYQLSISCTVRPLAEIFLYPRLVLMALLISTF